MTEAVAEKKEVEVSQDVKKALESALALSGDDRGVLILELVKEMKGLELNNAKTLMEDVFGVSAAAPMMMGPGAGPAAEEAEPAKTEWDVHLTGIGEKKIQVIKAVRSITSLGLKEAKSLVDNAPGVVKEGLSEDEAKKVKEELEAAGATVELK